MPGFREIFDGARAQMTRTCLMTLLPAARLREASLVKTCGRLVLNVISCYASMPSGLHRSGLFDKRCYFLRRDRESAADC